MKVDRRSSRLQLCVKDAAKRRGQGGIAVLVHAAVEDQDRVRRELSRVVPQVVGQCRPGDLLFAFDDEFQVDRRPAGCDKVLGCLDG